MPHGMCYLWRPEILALHVVSDAVIALSYFSIPIVLFTFALRRPDLTYRPIVWLFAAFIVLCGVTHLFSIWTVWNPDYMIEGGLKVMTAGVSLATAVVLWPLLPRALALPSTRSLEAANQELTEEVARRTRAEAELQAFAAVLERRVEQRTSDLERANAALRQFASTASHDLQAPLRHIRVFSDLLGREDGERLSADGRDYLGRINASAERMQDLITVLLDYARLTNTPPRCGSVSLTEVADAARRQLEADIAQADATVTVHDLPDAFADSTLIERVFDNLICNAIKYAGPDAPNVEITGRVRSDGLVEVTVTDAGPGVEPRYAEAVFEMLRRVHADSGVPGAGVGLAFCKQIVEAHGGRIWLDTAYTEGARFVFTLPTGPTGERGELQT